MKHIFGVAAVALPMFIGACDSAAESPKTEPLTIDTEALAAIAIGYDTGDLVQVSKDYVGSEHSGSNVRVWVSLDAVDAYRAVDPSAATAPRFEEGAIILKEQRTSTGDIDAFTLMVKGPPGYAPDTNDWHWQRVAPDGSTTHKGQVGFCISCHTPRKDADWVFGVPATNQVP